MNQTHLLKLSLRWLSAITDGTKKAEIRKNDRDFQAGDSVFFEVSDAPVGHPYAMEEMKRLDQEFQITHVLHSVSGLADDYVILSLEKRSVRGNEPSNVSDSCPIF